MDPYSLPSLEHEDPGFTPEDLEPRAFTPPPRRRVLWTLAVLAVVALLAIVPPLFHVNRFQKQIASSISQSLGRPVHAGEITLNLLPFPGFTIENFVVSEDPSFGSEPVIRASSVMARLRWRSLWRRRMEFSRITLSDASVNLVRRPTENGEAGRWNLESILLQASRMPAAPTGQPGPGDRPRFPYIEATGARVNLKMGLEKLPVSLTDADFALWLPEAEQWRLRLEAHPARTDAAVTDTGVLRLEGTLGRAANLADVPVNLHASWTAAPLGAASTVLLGRDAGFRGELTWSASLKGTAGSNALATRLRLDRVRRADFVPTHLVEVDLTCTAQALGNLHRLQNLRCALPTGSTDAGLTVTGELPDTLHLGSANLQASLRQFPAAGLLDILRLVSSRVSPDLTLDGSVNLRAACCQGPAWLTAADLSIGSASLTRGSAAFAAQDVTGTLAGGAVAVQPIALHLGAPTTAQIAATIGWSGYTLHLSGPATTGGLHDLAAALPPFADGLPDFPAPEPSTPLMLDLSATRTWNGPQQWTAPAPAKPLPLRRRHHR